MNPSIQAIVFDIGGTLRTGHKNEGCEQRQISLLQSILGETGDPGEFLLKIHAHEKKYREWCKNSLVELTEADLWTKFMLPDYAPEFIRENAVKLNQVWRDSRTKTLLPDAVQMIKTLADRGYALGIISNTTSSVEVPKLLEENGIANLFSSVILSTVFGRRKPHLSLFLACSREMGVLPENCAYVGDSLSRDLIGPRQAGFGEVIIINAPGYQQDEFDPDDEHRKETLTEMKPDFKIRRLDDLLNIFPERDRTHTVNTVSSSQPEILYEAALSTMWSVDQDMPFNDTFIAGRKIGFARFELNHKVPPELYRSWDANRFYIATVHDPCPAVYSYDAMKENDILISSRNEGRRNKGVDILKKTIDLACKLGSKSVVVHSGSINCDRSREVRLRKLFNSGFSDTSEYHEIAAELIADRAKLAPTYVERVMKSLTEVIDFAKNTGVSIALENRYRYYDLPLPDEMELFLGLCKESWFGFQYDIGHAQTLDALGLVKHQEWLDRFSDRMIGVHLHDVIGITDHQAPGLGEVNFRKIAPYLPENAFKTLEIGPQASTTEIASSLEVLAESGCIKRV